MTLAIRPALRTEIDAIRDLERASSQRFLGVMDALADDEPTPAEVLAQRLARDGLLAATLDEELAAFVMFRPLGFVDIADDALSAALQAVRREHLARGLDEGARLFMQRPI